MTKDKEAERDRPEAPERAIEITEEMVRAGALALIDFDIETELPEGAAKRIFVTMMRARNRDFQIEDWPV